MSPDQPTRPSLGLFQPRLPRAARIELGRAVRDQVPLEAHAELADRGDRASALATLQHQDASRLAELVPIRYGRMSATPFTYLRGAAAVMAADLAAGPRTEVPVQLCGDAHLSNFGAYLAPDRTLVFDLNDFDETLPGPFEWDVKRLVASVVVAGRNNELSPSKTRNAARAAARAYRTWIGRAATQNPIDLWYFRVPVDQLLELDTSSGAKKRHARLRAKAARKNNLGALDKLTSVVDGRRVITANPPLIQRFDPDRFEREADRIAELFDDYRSTLQADRRQLLEHFHLVDIAHKVVGVGSVGTHCLIALLESGDGEPLFLQLKEAVPSVLEAHLGPSTASQSGQRVVQGQRRMQAASDVLLGWARWHPGEPEQIDFYVRQLWDGKLSASVEEMGARRLTLYSKVCGAVLARAHARSGDPAIVHGYVDDPAFDDAMVAWAEQYADRTEADHAELLAAIDAGEVNATRDL